jgi:hypothetical protein
MLNQNGSLGFWDDKYSYSLRPIMKVLVFVTTNVEVPLGKRLRQYVTLYWAAAEILAVIQTPYHRVLL